MFDVIASSHSDTRKTGAFDTSMLQQLFGQQREGNLCSVDQKHRSCLSGPPHIPGGKPGSKMISFRDLPDEKIGRRFKDQVTNPVVIHNAT